MSRSLILPVVLFTLLLVFASRCLAASAIFREASSTETGISWTHVNGKSEHRYLPETTGGGVALFDYNNDGWMDILLINSGPAAFYTPAQPLHMALYRNNHDGTFTDVSIQAGLTAEIYGMGVAIGDYDGDGYQDIFVSGISKCLLYHNNGNGTFTDVTAESQISAPLWGSSSLWFDYDNDGKLDLFIGDFADYSNQRTCRAAESYGGANPNAPQWESAYCIPRVLKPAASHLYRNLGNGKFADVSEKTGIASLAGKLWGAVAADLNGDGYLDLFVSNDTMPNYLWMNRNGTSFEEIGTQAGVGYSNEGTTRSGMGVDAGDFDQDGREDLMVDNIDAQTTSLYRNLGGEVFDDVNVKTGVSGATRMLSGWGLAFFDYDNDGWPDIIQCDGHPDDLIEIHNSGIRYHQPLVLLHNLNGARMENVSTSAGVAFASRYSARGLAVGDLNNDGYPDVVFVENGGPVHVLMNTAQSGNNWLGVTLVGKTANPAGTGAVLRWKVKGRIFSRQKTSGGSFLSSRDPREILGAGRDKIDWVEVHWPKPSRCVERILYPPMNRYIVITEAEHPAPSSARH